MDDRHIVVVTGIVVYDGKILLLKRSDTMEMHPGKWSFPGGKINKGEDFISALRREIREEAGLEIGDDKKYVSDYFFTRPSGICTVGCCFLVNAVNNDVRLSQEFTDYGWIEPEDIDKYDIVPYLVDEVKKAFENI